MKKSVNSLRRYLFIALGGAMLAGANVAYASSTAAARRLDACSGGCAFHNDCVLYGGGSGCICFPLLGGPACIYWS